VPVAEHPQRPVAVVISTRPFDIAQLLAVAQARVSALCGARWQAGVESPFGRRLSNPFRVSN